MRIADAEASFRDYLAGVDLHLIGEEAEAVIAVMMAWHEGERADDAASVGGPRWRRCPPCFIGGALDRAAGDAAHMAGGRVTKPGMAPPVPSR